MPSITKTKLDEMTQAVETANDRRSAAEDRAAFAEAKGRNFDAILDKIVRAADGRPLIDNRNDFTAMNPSYMGERYGDPMRKLKTVERQEQEIARLNERIIGLEGRLAAVKAVATFAKEHKG